MPDLPPKHNPWGKPKLQRDRERRQRADAKRKDDPLRAQYKKPAWYRGRQKFLSRPGNERCWCGCGRKADAVHHRVAPRSAMPDLDRALALFWDESNWLPAYFDCNSREAARSEGGFGNPVRPPSPR